MPGGWHVHTAEGPGDEVDSYRKYGRPIVQRFEELGMLGDDSLFIHLVHVNNREMEPVSYTHLDVYKRQVAARAIMREVGVKADYDRPHPTVHQPVAPIRAKRALIINPLHGKDEGGRCLTCQDICEICTEVCPNRANISVKVPGFGSDPFQIVHIDGLCNECGNCGTFCPHAGLPYKDKITTFWTHEDFEESTNVGFLPNHDGGYLVRLPGGEETTISGASDPKLPAEMAAVLTALEANYAYLLAAPAGK